MKKIVTDKTGGYPLNLQRIQEIRDAYEMIQNLGNVIGDSSNGVILQGVDRQADGKSYSGGFIFIKTKAYPLGEVLEFKASTSGAYLTVTENKIQKMYANNMMQDVAIERTASITNSSSGESYPFANLKRYTIKENAEDIVTLKSKVSANETNLATNTSTITSINTSVGNNAANIAYNAPVMMGVVLNNVSGNVRFRGTYNASDVSTIANINNRAEITFSAGKDADDYVALISTQHVSTKGLYFEITNNSNKKTIKMYDASGSEVLWGSLTGGAAPRYHLAVYRVKNQQIN